MVGFYKCGDVLYSPSLNEIVVVICTPSKYDYILLEVSNEYSKAMSAIRSDFDYIKIGDL